MIRFDTLLVRALAAELAAALRGARLRSARFERPELVAWLTFRTRSGLRSLRLDLAPGRGWIRFEDGPPPRGNVNLPRNIRVADVIALPDERVLVIELGGEPHARVVIELLTNQWNALAVAADGRILRVLRPRRCVRPFRPGLAYQPPTPTGRAGIHDPIPMDEWRAHVGGHAPDDVRRALLRNVAWLSPLNVAWVLGREGTGVEDRTTASYARYLRIVTGPATPVLLRTPHGAQPYPHSLGALDAASYEALLDAFEAVASAETGTAPAATTAAPESPGPHDAVDTAGPAERARTLAERLRRRAQRLREELSGATVEAERLRGDADLLLAQLDRVERGAASVTLDDYEGGGRAVKLDPALTASENAQRLYTAARKRQRAADRLPALIATAASRAQALEAWAIAVLAGAADPASPPVPLEGAPIRKKGERDTPLLPYRTYRTSGGLEVRVGRGSRANDELTLRHASANDIWLHARDVAGAHVVLRWSDARANPPQRDLAEAAVLAALHSRARTSGVAAVDWTRRKYVRKHRKAPPGSVTLERANTIFVEPDESVARRMASGI
jgi:predicted ribosome quality control (RQC) complex YloA/Tae2 family protein